MKPSEAVRAKFPDNELLFSKRAMRDQIIAYLEELEKEEEKPKWIDISDLGEPLPTNIS